jgi:chondroitin 4-sulfotransferase 11
VPISHRLRCIFVHIPKTAGTSVEQALGMFGDWRQEDLQMMFGYTGRRMPNGEELSSPFLQHLTARELSKILPTEIWSYFRFAIVRNPWDRMVSVYSNKDPHLCNLARMQGIEFDGTSFDDFVAKTMELDHAHLRPQTDFVLGEHGELLLDYVGKWERLAQDFADVCDRLGVQLTLPRENISQRSHYRDYYSQSSRDMVAARYQADIEMFDYEF